MTTSFLVPTVPNSPLTSKDAIQTFGRMQLRRNTQLDFIENAAFDPALMRYDDNYQNSQAHSPHFLGHMKSVLEQLKAQFPAGSHAIEVGCGKGDFFELMQADGHFKGTGYDATYEGNNPNIEKRYLTADDRIDADLVVLRHVLEHVPQPHLFLEMLKRIFGNATIYIEVPSYDWIAQHQAFFDITYEHVNYFSQRTLQSLFTKAIAHGVCFDGQYQYIIADLATLSPGFASAYESGAWEGLEFNALFPSLQQRITDIEKRANSKIYIWGAATKGCMFLVHCANAGKLVDKVECAIDVNPNKCGKFLPGSLVRIEPKDYFFKHAKDGDLLIIANPNYEGEIREEIQSRKLTGIQIATL